MRIAIAFFVMISTQTVAHAGLISDIVTVEGFSPNISTISATKSTTVTADATDLLDFGGRLSVNPFASGFLVTSTAFSVSYGVGSFFEFTDLNFTPAATITGVNIVNGGSSLSFGTSFTDSTAKVDFNGGILSGQTFTVNLQTAAVPVPEPSTYALWTLAFGGFGVVRYRRRKRQAACES
jgi:hypothetical protein